MMTEDDWDFTLQQKRCEWQDSNLRTPTRTDLESVTVDRLVTLAPKYHYKEGDLPQ